MTALPHRPNDPWRDAIEAIHASATQMVLAVTGGGASALSELLALPGASNTLLEAVVPYGQKSLAEWLGQPPEQACSEPTARAMAMAAYQRAQLLSLSPETPVAGVAATASLATNRPKRGAHRVHVAWQTAGTTASISLEFDKGSRQRDAEETLARQLLLLATVEASAIEANPLEASIYLEASHLEASITGRLQSGEQLVRQRVDAPTDWQALLAGERQSLTLRCQATNPLALLPGAFNPIHSGHLRMAQLAEQQLGCPVAFELSIANVDKRPLDFIDLDHRLQPLTSHRVVVSSAATFVEKARLYPGTTFVVGADTLARIGQTRYYGNAPQQRDAAIAELAQLGCRFLVFGRLDGEKHENAPFLTLRHLSLPAALEELCKEVCETDFRDDVSSTQLRESL